MSADIHGGIYRRDIGNSQFSRCGKEQSATGSCKGDDRTFGLVTAAWGFTCSPSLIHRSPSASSILSLEVNSHSINLHEAYNVAIASYTLH